MNHLVKIGEKVKKDTKGKLDIAGELLEKVVPKLKSLFGSNKNDYSRALFYDLMVLLYDQFDKYKPIAKSALIRGLSDSSQ